MANRYFSRNPVFLNLQGRPATKGDLIVVDLTTKTFFIPKRRPLKITILGRQDEQMLKLLQYSLWKRWDYCIKCNHTWNNLLYDQN